ncbi:FAD/NAD-P-binding domain-containing protein [Lenzites betulinus]|nr:FAD/NAD-P-binding domain-containing protein [Lenzites betulinus]
MSATSKSSVQTTSPVKFLVTGGGIAGLACALALRRVGHHAVVLERGNRKTVRGEGGLRLPPNVTKIFFQWGLQDALRASASVSHTIRFTRYESGESLGRQVWNAEVLKETQGIFMVITHAELYDILYEAAIRAGARVQFNAEVVSVAAKEREVELATGETLSGDVLVGADGEYGPSRTAVAKRQLQGAHTGLAMYDTIVPSKYLPECLAALRKDNDVLVAFGEGRSMLGFPVHNQEDFALQFYGPDENIHGTYGDPPSVPVCEIAQTLDPQLRSIVENARMAVRIPLRAHEDLEDWVHDDGRLVLIGDAAHPFPPGTIQATAMAVEDGAVLAKLFSHLSEERQIDSFLLAFQELRQSRAEDVRASEFNASFFMSLSGDGAAQRDAAMRAQYLAGGNALDGVGGETSAAWEQIRTIFGYDCEDAADDWWVQWGLLRERALEREMYDGGEGTSHAPPLLDFSAMTVQTREEIWRQAIPLTPMGYGAHVLGYGGPRLYEE